MNQPNVTSSSLPATLSRGGRWVLPCLAAVAVVWTGCGSPSSAASAKAASGAAAKPTTAPVKAAPATGQSLFDGRTLTGWKVSGFAGGGEVKVDPNFRGGGPALVIDAGASLSGLTFTNPVPKTNFEITLEALKVQGNDFFCGLTFPVGTNHATLVLGGWGGATVGISSIDGLDASENDTTKFLTFPKDKWFTIRMKVTPTKLEAWLNDEKIVDQDIKDRRISMRFGEIEESVPLGIATYQTTSVMRNLRLKRLE
jgi:hypothetical protein